MNRNRKNENKRLWMIGAILIAVAAIILVCLFFLKQKEPVKTAAQPKKLELTYVKGKSGEQQVDFNSLQSVNPDIYAWLEIPGTNINYPVVQSTDDPFYYLDYTYERKEGIEGSIYTENYNTKEFTDFNTVLYGHVMKRDKTMFSQLHKYEEEAFFQEAPYVYIYTPAKQMKYQVFSAVEYDDRHLLKSIDFKDLVSREEFLNDIRGRRDMLSHTDESVPVDANSRILTLSTCNPRDAKTRWLVTAVLIEEMPV